jgi:hypothetical protein
MRADDDEPAEVNVEGVLAQFKVVVAVEISLSDVATHFDLAAAYAKMGLLRDAMDELAIVLQADPAHVPARTAMVELRLRLDRPDGEPPDEIA